MRKRSPLYQKLSLDIAPGLGAPPAKKRKVPWLRLEGLATGWVIVHEWMAKVCTL